MKSNGIEWYYHPTREYFATKFAGAELFITPIPVMPIQWKVSIKRKGVPKISIRSPFNDFDEAAKAIMKLAKPMVPKL